MVRSHLKNMIKLKRISNEGIAEALGKAERYRLLNEPQFAESICLDILEIEPDNHRANVTLLLSMTDLFGRAESASVSEARQVLDRFNSEYDKLYYGGIICERQGNSILEKKTMASNYIAYDWLIKAMKLYEKAEAVRPPGNDDSILRWNTCSRVILRHNLKPEKETNSEPPLE